LSKHKYNDINTILHTLGGLPKKQSLINADYLSGSCLGRH